MLLAATAATRLGDLEAARWLADGALAGSLARGDGRMRALNLLGVIEFEQGRLDDAEDTRAAVLALCRANQREQAERYRREAIDGYRGLGADHLAERLSRGRERHGGLEGLVLELATRRAHRSQAVFAPPAGPPTPTDPGPGPILRRRRLSLRRSLVD